MADKNSYASTFVCVLLSNEGEIESKIGFNSFQTLQHTCT